MMWESLDRQRSFIFELALQLGDLVVIDQGGPARQSCLLPPRLKCVVAVKFSLVLGHQMPLRIQPIEKTLASRRSLVAENFSANVVVEYGAHQRLIDLRVSAMKN